MFIMRSGYNTATVLPMTLTGTLPAATQGTAYSSTLTLGGTFVTPVTFTASSGSIPTWMTISLSGTTVTCSGTPTSAGTETFTIQATDSTPGTAQTATSAQSIVVAAASGIALVNSTSSSGITNNASTALPTGSVGDLIFVSSVETNSGGTPTGFTLLSTTATTGGQLTISLYYKIADGTETSPITSDYGGNTSGWAMVAQRWSGVNATTPIDASLVSVNNTASSSPVSVTAASITTTAANDLVMFVGCTGDYSALGSLLYTTPSGFSNAVEPAQASNGSIIVASKTQATAGATGAVTSTATFTSGTSQGFGAALIALKAA